MKSKIIIYLNVSLAFVSTNVFAVTPEGSVNNYLRNRLAFFDITKYESQPVNSSDDYKARVELGRKLFIETNLSGNKKVSCLTCHKPGRGTSDGMPLSQTEDGKGVLRRNSSSLFNIGDKFNTFMFWDGRVRYQPSLNIFTTPESALNGPNPSASHITGILKSALSAQALFPIVTHDEMRGKKGENEIADAKNNLEAWDLVIKRITTNPANDSARYIALFNRAYPELGGDVQKINIGHAGEAMGTFMREQFQSNTSPFHRYVAGDDQAMTAQQKRGLMVFMEEGKCIACHQGSLLGNNAFFASVGTPSYGARPFRPDLGRGEVGNETFRNYFFKVPSLINVALTAPYMHNGAFKTIREVLNHYNNINGSLKTFDISKRRNEFPVEVEVLNSNEDLNNNWNAIQAGFLKQGLGLSEKSLDDLEVFLTEALTDPKWAPQR
jgi:cytochrome c peroxidase